MKNVMIAAVFAGGVVLGYSGHAWTQTASKLPMPGVPRAVLADDRADRAGLQRGEDFAGAKELPGPEHRLQGCLFVAANAEDNKSIRR